jgi:hypothetical protein
MVGYAFFFRECLHVLIVAASLKVQEKNACSFVTEPSFSPVSWHCHPLNMTTSVLAPTLISSVPELEAFISSMPPSSTLYPDLEGNCLNRHGTIPFIAVLIYPRRVVRLIDVLVLGKLAFTTASNNGKTLNSMLKDPDIPKCA